MSDTTLKRERKRRRVADDAGSARNATSITTHDQTNESQHVQEAPGNAEIKVILAGDGKIKDSRIVETLGRICKSLGRTVYMADPAELSSMLGSKYTRNMAIKKSIEHCSTIFLPILSNRSQDNKAKHWVLVVVSHDTSRLYCAQYKEGRVNDAVDGTNAFINHYLEDSRFNPGNSLYQCACCVHTGNADSGVCVFAFSMYVIAQCPMPHHLPTDTWRLIMEYLLGFKDDSRVERNKLLRKRNLADACFDIATPGLGDKSKLEWHCDDADDFIVEATEILMVLRKVLDQITGSSGSGQSTSNTTEAAADENEVERARTSRERLSLVSTDLSTLCDEMKKHRDRLSDMISKLAEGMAAATG